MNYEVVCRIAPATTGLLNTDTKEKKKKKEEKIHQEKEKNLNTH